MTAAPPLRRATKILYGIGSIGYGVKDVAFRSFILIYYNQIIGVRADLVSLAVFVALLVDAVSDPIVGQFSDSLRTKWGRRHPLMYAAALPAAGSFLLLWMPPEGLSDVQMFFYILIVGSAVRTFITFYEIPSSALAPELTSDYDERTTIASYRWFFGVTGGLGLAFLTLYVFLRPTEEYPIGQLNPAGYWLFGVTGAAVMIVTILTSSLGTHHRIKYLRKASPPSGQGLLTTLGQMRESFAHIGILAVLIFGFLKYTAIGMHSALLIYFGTYFWELNSGQLAILLVNGIAAAFGALMLAPYASRKIGKRNAAVLLAIVAVLCIATPYTLRLLGLFFPNGHDMLLPAIFVFDMLYSLCGISSAILVHAMIGDVVEESSLRTGRRAEGLFYAANSFIQKSVSGMGVFVAGVVLALVGFPENAQPGQVEPSAIRNLVLAYLPVMTGFYIGGACFLFLYKIDRDSHEANLAKIRDLENPLVGETAGADAIAGTVVEEEKRP